MRTLFPGNAEGYTLVEILVAVTILSMVAAPLLGLLATGFTAVHLAGQQTVAVNLCREKIESTKAPGYAAVHAHYVTGGNSPAEENPVAGFPAFRRVTTVQLAELDTGGELELLLVRVTVFWTAKGVERSETLESFLSSR